MSYEFGPSFANLEAALKSFCASMEVGEGFTLDHFQITQDGRATHEIWVYLLENGVLPVGSPRR